MCYKMLERRDLMRFCYKIPLPAYTHCMRFCYKIPLPAYSQCYRVVPVDLSVDLIWPSTTLRGCLFHFKQAFIRHAYSIDLKADYVTISNPDAWCPCVGTLGRSRRGLPHYQIYSLFWPCWVPLVLWRDLDWHTNFTCSLLTIPM